MQKFIKENWFKIAVVLFLFPFFSVIIIKASNYSYFEESKPFIVFVDENMAGIIFLIFVIYLLFIYRWSCKSYHDYKILKKYKRENNDNDKNYTAKFCEEDCVFELQKDRKITNEDKILDWGKNIYLVDEKSYRHIVDGYTFRELGYPDPNKYRRGCFSKKGKELKEEIKIYNIISDIKNILDIKNNI